MYIITAVGLIWFFVTFAICMAGAASRHDDIICAGIVSLVLFGWSVFIFQMGAEWQKHDTLSKYQLIELKNLDQH